MNPIEPDGRDRQTAWSRRQLLQRAAAAGVVLPLANRLGGSEAVAQSRAPLPAFDLSPPSFSVAERDRRWAAVRATMAKPQWNLDAIITVVSDQVGSNARYLTQVELVRYSGGGPQVVFARDPAKPVLVQASAARHVEEWTARLKEGAWLADGKMKLLPETGGDALAKLLVAEGYNRAGVRIGVAKLKGTRFDPDGVVSATLLDALKAALPGAAFLPIEKWGQDAGPVDEAMLVKSREEQDVIRRAVKANEQGLAAMVSACRGGAAKQSDLWWAGFVTMAGSTGDDVIRLSIGLNEGGNASLGEANGDAVHVGQFCSQEISSGFQGYGCQINHTFFIGGAKTPGHAYYLATFEALRKAHEKSLAFIQPGKTTYDEFEKYLRKMLVEAGGAEGGGVAVHSGGMGQARPRGGRDNEMIMQPGHVFDFKPSLALQRTAIKDVGERNRSVQLGDAILVTDTGVARLGTRRLVPITTQD
ncbi:MAG: M24 family metallopeptidase [Acidobacteriota bacterium]